MRRSARRPFLPLPLLGLLLIPHAAPAASAASADPAPAAPERRAVVVSIDGLMPGDYLEADALGLAIPNLRRLMSEGAWARGVVGVLPSVTYPSHTTLVTGVPPRVHGIGSNSIVDPEGKAGGAWHWFASAIRVPTLVSAAEARGLVTGAVSWPVSVGLGADFNLPEIWRPGSSHPVDLEMLRLLSSPPGPAGLIRAVEIDRGRPFPYPLTEDERVDTAVHVLRRQRPHLLLVHLFDLDHEQHEHGPRIPQALAALEATDAALGRLLAEIDAAGLAGSTLFAVVSDHGFLPVERELRPNALLREAGLIEVDEEGEVTSWRAAFHQDGGSAALYLAEPGAADAAALVERVRGLLAPYAADPASGLREILGPERIAALGGPAEAALALDAEAGFRFVNDAAGEWSAPTTSRGHHGFAPDRPEMHAALIVRAPGLARRGDLGVVPMTAIAPTVAAWLGLTLAPEAAEPLELWRP